MKSSKTIKRVMEMITCISLVLYMFDVVLLGTGELTKSCGIQSRMIFFGISVLAAVVLILLDLKKYLNNKYLISVLVFMVVIFIAAIRGFVGKQNTTILLSDFKGFLNFFTSSQYPTFTKSTGLYSGWRFLLGNVTKL